MTTLFLSERPEMDEGARDLLTQLRNARHNQPVMRTYVRSSNGWLFVLSTTNDRIHQGIGKLDESARETLCTLLAGRLARASETVFSFDLAGTDPRPSNQYNSWHVVQAKPAERDGKTITYQLSPARC